TARHVPEPPALLHLQPDLRRVRRPRLAQPRAAGLRVRLLREVADRGSDPRRSGPQLRAARGAGPLSRAALGPLPLGERDHAAVRRARLAGLGPRGRPYAPIPLGRAEGRGDALGVLRARGDRGLLVAGPAG